MATPEFTARAGSEVSKNDLESLGNLLTRGEEMALYGIYGSHTVESCPVNHRGNAEKLISFAESDPTPLMSKYRIKKKLALEKDERLSEFLRAI